ncbi:ubiquitin-protein ligase E3A [Anopheles bellator]|uniref:ubiquitin-protein ligase E3A n=1 Tax=Anopheles bellator TaxID=139047 RepID=UPI002647604C|nr:ubiquitin-protein ligase E3A [Anopheles bellator]
MNTAKEKSLSDDDSRNDEESSPTAPRSSKDESDETNSNNQQTARTDRMSHGACGHSSSNRSMRANKNEHPNARVVPQSGAQSSKGSAGGRRAANEEQEMKRASAKKLIEQYFYQLVDGCGNPSCTNKHCASSGKVEKLTPNAAAARAIQLFSQEATLCYEAQPSKVQKTEQKYTASGSSSAAADRKCNQARRTSPRLQQTPAVTAAAVSNQRAESMEVAYESSAQDLESMEDDTMTPLECSDGIGDMEHSPAEKNATSSSSSSRGGVKTPSNPRDSAPGVGGGSKTASSTTQYLDEQILQEFSDQCTALGSDTLLIRPLGAIFSSYHLLAASFQRSKATSSIDRVLARAPPGDLRNMKKEDLRSLEGDLDKDEDSKAPAAESPQEAADPNHTGVDLASLRRSIKALYAARPTVFGPINNALQTLGDSLARDLRVKLTSTEELESIVTVFVIVFETLLIGSAELLDGSFSRICSAVSYLPVWAQARLVRVWAHNCPDSIHPLLQQLQQLVTISTLSPSSYRHVRVHDNDDVCNAIRTMKLVFYANILAGELEPKHYRETDLRDTSLPTYLSLIAEDDDDLTMMGDDDDDAGSGTGSERKGKQKGKFEDPLAKELDVNPLDCRRPLVPYGEFYNETLCEHIEMDHDYLVYKNISAEMAQSQAAGETRSRHFCFMYYSFVLTPATKTLALYYDSRIRMFSERRLSYLHNANIGSNAGLQSLNPFLNLRIRRDHIIDDALVELEIIAMSNPKDLKKQLVVEFTGEQGIDEGGVSKEFFQLIIEEIFNPDYGMFVSNDDSNTVWFNSMSFENEAQFTLIGIVLGLAIYNNIILAVNFPMVVYRKLMGMKGSFLDLKDLNPVLFNSLTSLLEYTENDMEEVFMQTFKIGYRDVFGNTLEHELKPDGDKAFVTQDNKQEFVDLYSDFLLNQSVEKQFHAFRRGFQMVTDESPLHLLFRPEEVELIVCGSKEFDFNELEKSTEYEAGFTADSQTIKDFWTIVHGLSVEAKRKLLQFTTGSDRVPVGGLSRLKLVIARNGPDCDRLPTSHTCFNVLLLPEYDSKEKLEERLLKAINYSKGFGML